ncbi:MAG: DNA helicase RecQ [Candidatus Marinimicrobia bacterium]|nr:DNA helicase RecQ [Candidatus Neomarinimicrobiota bacterium]MBL7122740.1 DNA helicase RecQ [Candidatus Neomarinimicrobiota bacterium]
MINEVHSILKDIFGYDDFRPLQKEVIENVLKKKDTLCIMPTGSGKSLCYQIPALLFDGLTIVVSPLISLMEDQVKQLEALGVEALMLNSSLSTNEYQNNIQLIRQGKVRLLYLAPETLLMERTLALLEPQKVVSFIIDEAHCISEWGHDFRPEYRQLMDLRKRFPEAVCLALTATATQRVQRDIQKSLRFDKSASFVASFNRENLFLEIKQKSQSAQQTLDFLARFPDQSGIIYCLSRKQVDEMAEFLQDEGYSVKPYHAGLSPEVRQQNQSSFIRDDTQIMVATIAFGMGINKPNVRFVLHYDLPSNIESYYQQIGRAGRDGLRADCLFLFGYGDIRKIKFFIGQKKESEQVIAHTQLNALVGFAETDDCRRIPLLTYFGETYHDANCGMCDNCLSDNQTSQDVTIPAQQFLSCVKHSKQIFGAGQIIDILRGSKSQKVKKFGHQELSTYGIGKDYSKTEWFYLSRQFVQKGLLTQDMEHGSLKLTAKAWEVLRGQQNISVPLEERQKKRPPPKTEQPYDASLFELLRQLRKTLADDSNVPPYVVFPDKTLIEMAIYFPQSEDAMLQLHGVGKVKFVRYGTSFIQTIAEYCQTNQLKEKPKDGPHRKIKSLTKTIGAPRHQIVGEKFNSGSTILELSKEFKVQNKTVLDHLYRYYAEGNTLRSNSDFLELSQLSSTTQKEVCQAIEQHGTLTLRPVFETLRQKISYQELKIIRLHYLANEQKQT